MILISQGPLTLTVNWNVNLKKGYGTANGKFQKDIFSRGSWTDTYNGKLYLTDPPVYDIFGLDVYLMEGKDIGTGQGEFEGMELRAEFTQEGYDPGEVGHPCNDIFNRWDLPLPGPAGANAQKVIYTIEL